MRLHWTWAVYLFLGKGTDHPDSLGKVTDLRNQAIALPTPILCKMCEHIIYCANIAHLSEHDTLTDSQHGFLKRSCDIQFIRTIHDLVSGSEEKGHTNPILLDFAKSVRQGNQLFIATSD